MADELLYPPGTGSQKRDTPSVDAVRGFVFTSGRKWIEDRGLGDRFLELLPERLRDGVQTMAATDWVPLEDALDVYAACDALALTVEEMTALGRSVSAANNGIVIRTLSKLAGHVGVSPWMALKHADRIWQRNNRGGGIAVFKIGERVARLEFWRVPMARSPFFITSMRGALAVGIEDFCDSVVIAEIPDATTSDGFALRVAW